jgi:thiol-disulfide isomerase/thioredoxin
MKKYTLAFFFFVFLLNIQAQTSLPKNIQGNWLAASDSIRWVCSLQPNFALIDNSFWNYKSVSMTGNSCRIILTNGKEIRKLTLNGIDESTLRIKNNAEVTLCTRLKSKKPDFHHDTTIFKISRLLSDTATIAGFIENYDPAVFSSKGTILYYNPVTGFLETESLTNFKITTDGRFEVKFKMYNPQLVTLIIEGSTQTRLFAGPGQISFVCFNKNIVDLTRNTDLWANFTDWDVNHYMGNSGMLSEELILLMNFIENMDDEDWNLGMDKSLPELEYLNWEKTRYLQHLDAADSLMVIMNCSEKSRQVVHTWLILDYCSDLLDLGFKKGLLTEHYLAGIPQIDLEVPGLLESGKITQYINSLLTVYNTQPLKGSFAAYEKQMLRLAESVKDSNDRITISDWLRQYQGYEWPELRMDSILTPPDSILSKELQDYFLALSSLEKYQYMLKGMQTSIHLDKLNRIMADYQDEYLGKLLCTNELIQVQDFRMLDDDEINWAWLKINDQIMLDKIIERHMNQYQIMNDSTDFAEGTYFIDKIDSTATADKLFDQIVGQFNGKVIYIDFWANWCAPCRAEFPYADKLKNEYAGKDVVFLYFGLGCSKDNWSKMIRIRQITGFHYWLDKNQGKLLSDKFGIIGIPHFLLVDKNGKLIPGEIPRPSSETEIREMLDRLLAN